MAISIDDLVAAPVKKSLALDINSLLSLVKRVGQFELEGVGSETQFCDTVFDNYIGAADSTDAFSADSEKDRLLRNLDLDTRMKLADYAFNIELGSEPTLTDVHSSGLEYLERLNMEMFPVLNGFLAENPGLQKHKSFIFSTDFYMICKDLYQNLLCENIIERAGEGSSSMIIAPLGQVRHVLAEKTDSEFTASTLPQRIKAKYKTASDPRNWISAERKKNHPAPDRNDIVAYATMSHLFIDNPRAISSVISALRAIHSYAGNPEDYSRVVLSIRQNLKNCGIPFKYEDSYAKEQSGLQRFKTSIDSDPDETSLALFNILKDLSNAASNYATDVLDPLTKSRTADSTANASSALSGILGDEFNEGMLNKADGHHCASLEKRLHKELGVVWQFVYATREPARKIFMQHGGPKMLSALSHIPGGKKISVDSIVSLQGTDDIRLDPFADMVKFSLPVMGVYGWTVIKDRLGDNKPLFSNYDAAKEIITYIMNGNILTLLSDAWNKEDIPDNPVGASIKEYPRVVSALDVVGPTGNPDSRVVYSRGPLSILFNNNIDGILRGVSAHELCLDEDNIPTIAAIGVLNARRQNFPQARRYLGMTERWAEYAIKKLNLPASNWLSMALYEQSLIAPTNEEKARLLERSLEATSMEYMLDVPVFTAEKTPSYYALTQPMNYVVRGINIGLFPERFRAPQINRALREMKLLREKATGEKREYFDELLPKMQKLLPGEAKPEPTASSARTMIYRIVD